MSDPLERLEKELEGLRPIEPSAELRQRVGDGIADEGRAVAMGRQRRRRFYLGSAAGFMAACLAIGVWIWPTGSVSDPDAVTPIVDGVAALPANGSGPTLAACRVAANRSPEALAALLDRHADRVLVPHEPVTRAGWSALLRNGIPN